MQQSGKFIISLDFELLWGMRDHETIKSYGENILGVRKALPNMLELFESFGVKATFATVGFLFASSKNELISFLPKERPQYINKNLSPYNGYLNKIEKSEDEDEYHYAAKLIELIRNYPDHEIASHTFSHFYCLEEGQTVEEFKSDIDAAINIAKSKGIEIKSIVFPRNQVNENYLMICKYFGITSYRGNEDSWIYKPESREDETLFKRFVRLLDSYVNISGHNCYSIKDIEKKQPFNIPSSMFLRPYNPRFKFGEYYRINRILNSMTYAAKNGEVFHLCWHPHNFGMYSIQNFRVLIMILKHYKVLHLEYNFESLTMEELSQILIRQ